MKLPDDSMLPCWRILFRIVPLVVNILTAQSTKYLTSRQGLDESKLSQEFTWALV